MAAVTERILPLLLPLLAATGASVEGLKEDKKFLVESIKGQRTRMGRESAF